MDFTALSLAELTTGFEDVARETHDVFGSLTPRQLNWRPDATRWSVGQCFDHLLIINGLMLGATRNTLNGVAPRTLWQRLPFMPGVVGRMMVRSQSPQAERRFTAPPMARPTTSDISPEVVDRFVQQQHDTGVWLRSVDESVASRTVMTSPFVKVITYSVLDGCRLMLAHDRRHFEQARRVMLSREFPSA